MIHDKILLVDDEPRVLSALARELFELDLETILTARSADEALKQLQANPDTAVIVSDYRMPVINGVEFLMRSQKFCPDATRIMLTGVADLQIVMDAVNQANIFRFLIKPCPAKILLDAIRAGIRQHQLVVNERELLSQTLNGSVKVLVDILSSLSPEIFARTNNLRIMARDLASALGLEFVWDVELATLLCRLGSVSVPKEILDKWRWEEELNREEQQMIDAIPEMGSMLLRNIPWLDKVAESIRWQNCSYYRKKGDTQSLAGEMIPLTSRILKVLLDYDWLLKSSYNSYDAYQKLMKKKAEYDPQVLERFCKVVLGFDEYSQAVSGRPIIESTLVSIYDLKAGMLLTEDVLDTSERLVISRGTRISQVLCYRLVNYYRLRYIKGFILVDKNSFIST